MGNNIIGVLCVSVYLIWQIPLIITAQIISSIVPVTKTFTPALFLTPLIKRGQIQEARNLSSVDPKYFLNVSSHSGFLTVDEKYDSNLFFWYFPVAGRPVNETPWIIWLQGGPGATSLYGLFDEIGPFKYDDKLILNEWSWGKDYSLLFIDNPVGTGFSFTNSSDGLVDNMETCSEHLYKALQQLLVVFPELRKAPLYIAGESYAGKYIPALAMRILKAKVAPGESDDSNTINLQGLMMGNPVQDREDIADYSTVFYEWGLIDSQGKLAVKPLQDAYIKAIRDNNNDAAVHLRSDLLDKLQTMSSQSQLYNVLRDYNNLRNFDKYLSLPEVMNAIHVELTPLYISNRNVQEKLLPDFLSPVRSKIETLLEHYKMLIYCGQLDLTTPCTLNAKPRRETWNWSRRRVFLQAARVPWWFNGTVAGYIKSGGGLTEVLVKGAGHLAPIDKPIEIKEMISYFIRNQTVPVSPEYAFEDSDVPESTEPGRSNFDLKPANAGYITSVTINVLLVLVVVGGLWYLYRLKRKHSRLMLSDDSLSSLPEGVLTMT